MPREAIKYIKENLKGYLIGAEIGVSKGTHALEILQTLNCKLYLIDIWEDYYESFLLNQAPNLSKKCASKEQVEKLLKNYNIETIKGDSIEVAIKFPNGYFDFVYIDGNHTYENVKADILAWKPKVKIGGVLCGHDYTNECEGVKKAVDELLPNVMSIPNIRYPDWWIEIGE